MQAHSRCHIMILLGMLILIDARATTAPQLELSLGLFLAPCNDSDHFQRWSGVALTSPGSVSIIRNEGIGQCLSTLARDPAVVGPCNSGAATWIFNSSNLTLALVDPSHDGLPDVAGVCLDIHGGSGPELGLWTCHSLPPDSCHTDGECSSDWKHQQLLYNVTSGTLRVASPTGISGVTHCSSQCVTLRHPDQITPVDGNEECSSTAGLTMLPQDKGDESPACLDGSPYGFYHVKSKQGSTKWTLYLEGGGWCYDEQECHERAQTDLGSSFHFPQTHDCMCRNTVAHGLDPDCNCIFMKYADGASFAGYRAKPWPVPGVPNATLFFRGIKNLDATVQWALRHGGMAQATELVVTGGSAGGLSVFLHADRIAAAARKGAPSLKKVVAVPEVGYFIDHSNYLHGTGVPNTPSWGSANFTAWMLYIAVMQNMTFGADGGLQQSCQALHPGQPLLCFMAPHMVSTIETPIFMFNSRFDQFQLGSILQQMNWTTSAQRNAVIEFGSSFLKQLDPVLMHSRNGAFISTCICHGCPWDDLEIGGKTSYQHYAAWFAGEPGPHVHIDYRPPNGGGLMSSKCQPFISPTPSMLQYELLV